MALVPVQVGPGVGDDPRLLSAEELGGRPRVLVSPFGRVLQLGGCAAVGRDVDDEVGHLPQEPQEDGISVDSQPVQVPGAQPPQACAGALHDGYVQLPHGKEPAGGITGPVEEPLLVPALGLSPVEGIAGVDVGDLRSDVAHGLFQLGDPGWAVHPGPLPR